MNFIRKFFLRRKLRGEKDSVRRLFFERNNAFANSTIQILEKMPGAIDAISEFIDEKETFKEGGVLTWTEVSLVNHDTEEALIILVGMVTFPTGSKVVLETGEKVEVTPDTAQYFPPRIIRIGLPLNLAEASKDEIKTYMKQREIEQEAEV